MAINETWRSRTNATRRHLPYVKVVPHDATKLKVSDEGNKPANNDYHPINLSENHLLTILKR
jgi:hypothetical protein